MKRVYVEISLLQMSGRDILSGILHASESGLGWEIVLLQDEGNGLTVEKIHEISKTADGLIVTDLCSPEIREALVTWPIPLVLIGIRDERIANRTAPTAVVLNDNAAIGRAGADYFQRIGRFASHGFVPSFADEDWSREREAAYCERLRQQGHTVSVFRPNSRIKNDDNSIPIQEWLLTLPRPSAIMTACDREALHVIEACAGAHLQVGRQIALLGADNDELICSLTIPPLSSILPGHEEMGARAVALLDKLMRGKRMPSRQPVVVPPVRIVERSSTRQTPPATILVQRAKSFIRENACKGIGVADIIEHLHVSRRLIEMRFRDAEGKTLGQAIEETRFAKLERLLKNSNRRIADIAAACGFKSPSSLAHLFLKRRGQSMRDFRQSRAQSGITH